MARLKLRLGPTGRARTVWEGPKGPTARPNGRAVYNLCYVDSVLMFLKIIGFFDIFWTPFTSNLRHPDFRVIELRASFVKIFISVIVSH